MGAVVELEEAVAGDVALLCLALRETISVWATVAGDGVAWHLQALGGNGY